MTRWFIASGWLAFWQIRQMWSVLLLIGCMTLLASSILCAIPLFSGMALQSSLQDAFAATSPASARIIRIGADANVLTPHQLAGTESDITSLMQQHFGSLLTGQPTLSVKSWNYDLYPGKPDAHHTIPPTKVQIVSAADAVMRAHLALLSGMLPQYGANAPLELVIAADTAQMWHVTVGVTVFIAIPPARFNAKNGHMLLSARIVGIAVPQPNDTIFGQDFANGSLTSASSQTTAIFGNFAALFALSSQEKAPPSDHGDVFAYDWNYAINPTRLRVEQLNFFLAQGNILAVQLQDHATDWPNILSTYMASDDFFATLAHVQRHVILFQTPVLLLLIELVAFTLFFVSIIGEYLIDWQWDTITTLRSRGMEQGILFAAVALQGLGIGTIALFFGPAIAALMVALLSAAVFHNADAITITNLLSQTWSVMAYAALALGMIFLTLISAIIRAARGNVVSARRERAREQHKPLWMRWYLDVALALSGIIGYLTYHQVGQNLGENVLYSNQYLLFLSFAAPFVLVVAVALVVFRGFSLLLTLGERLASRYPGIVPIFTLAQRARAPHRTINITIFLALAVCMMLFTMTLFATQQQRIAAVAAYTVGADFRGVAPQFSGASVASIIAPYQALPGVISVSAGTSFDVSYAASDTNITLEVLGIDASTFGNTAYWDANMNRLPLPSLMKQLVAARQQASVTKTVPAYVDTALWDALHLSNGAPFSLSLPGYTQSAMNFVTLGRVDAIPTLFDTPESANQEGGVAGGMLVDYQTLKTIYTQAVPNNTVAPTTVWLRTQGDRNTLARIRNALQQGSLRLEQVEDRNALIEHTQHDPLEKDLFVAQAFVAATALVLAIISVFYAAWFDSTQQEIAFAILRALGTERRILRWSMVWEQGTNLMIGVALGTVLGSMTVVAIVPLLAFAQLIDTSGAFSTPAIQTPPVQIVIPVGIVTLSLVGLLTISFCGAFILTSRAARRSMSRVLRLNQD